ncbi:coiled-coil domain-containing protein 9-like isoform X2 [Poecile atricapillus]|uniref:coiled-coil domain-containing protein 9-like isoform X2 n=1 Tax=Poecile atricapillus TaxID=48891 RepID=UPI0027393F30|nr:coiled-coil domain-containing protein 9-like isoform X2 [Poecile atricapillus]
MGNWGKVGILGWDLGEFLGFWGVWERERDRIDRERLERHRDPKGAWRREWDAQKPEGMFLGLPEDPEGGGGAPPIPPRGQLRPLPHPQRRRGRAGGGGAYSFHDDRWEPQPEPQSPEVPGKVPEAAPGAPGSPGDSDQWEDVSEEEEEEEEEEPQDPPRPPPPAPPPPEGGVPEPPLPPPEPSGSPPDVPGVEISDFQREEPATPPRCDGGGTLNPT